VLSPLLDGLECHPELPFASSLCGACTEVCSARIPLATFLRELREDYVADVEAAPSWRLGFQAFDAAARRPRLWAAGETLALPFVRLASAAVTAAGARLRLPGALGAWTRSRDLPRPGRRSFRTLWRRWGGR
jgi:L-lactate dehydrogenase complex protein LldF